MNNTPLLNQIIDYLDVELSTSEIPDYSGALNGLQFQNSGKVTHVAAAVDASLPVIRKAVDAGADLLLVHHGLFWQGAQPVVEAQYEKTKLALESDLAIYSSHIPLDVHAKWGNNAQLAQAIGMDDVEPFFQWKGIELGLQQELYMSLDELIERVSKAVESDVHVCRGGKKSVGKVGVVTGGAGSEVAAASEQGIDTFITGEGPHWSYPLAEELGMNVIYAGHYATETFGVKALAAELAEKYQLEQSFIHHPTGL